MAGNIFPFIKCPSKQLSEEIFLRLLSSMSLLFVTPSITVTMNSSNRAWKPTKKDSEGVMAATVIKEREEIKIVGQSISKHKRLTVIPCNKGYELSLSCVNDCHSYMRNTQKAEAVFQYIFKIKTSTVIKIFEWQRAHRIMNAHHKENVVQKTGYSEGLFPPCNPLV